MNVANLKLSLCKKKLINLQKNNIFFYIILIFNKILLKNKLLYLHYNNALTKHFKIKKIAFL